MEITSQVLRLDPEMELPEYKTEGAVGFDLAPREDVTLEPGEMKVVKTGLVICTPAGHMMIIASRSSGAKKGIVVGHGIGVIDPDFCGPEDELRLVLRNIGKEPYTVKKGERIAQGIFVPVTRATFEVVDSLDAPSRGGFGSTGS